MAEVIERMAVVETKIEAIHETLTNVEAKLSATLEGQNRMNVYEKIGQGLFKTLQALAAALLGAWAAIHFGGK